MKQPAIKLATGDRVEGPLVILGCFHRHKAELYRLGRQLGSTVERALDRSGWKAERKQIVRESTRGKEPVRVEIYGLGGRESFDGDRLSAWLEGLLARLRTEGEERFQLLLPDHPACRGRAALRILTSILLSGYEFDRFKSQRSRARIKTIWLTVPEDEKDGYRRALRLARPLSRAIGLTRDLGNSPPNIANPAWIAEQAESLAERLDLECEVLNPDSLEARGMGGILAVGQGSRNPPRLVRLEGGSGDTTVALVGKGVTFDTGGISIKPSSGMEEMKYDKAGACTVLGAVQAISEMRLEVRFRAYLPLAENMPGGGSYRPGDIVQCYNGKRVEILDTDAEGRMILADALAWAAEGKPDYLVEMSTLTGASVVALGHHGAALYCPHDSLAQGLLTAAHNAGEKLWRMPLWPEFAEEMKGAHADLRNLGVRWGGANSAAAFLANFMEPVQTWAHLDIAGTAYRASREAGTSGATGYGIRLLIDWLLSMSDRF